MWNIPQCKRYLMDNLGDGQLVHVAEEIQHNEKGDQFDTLYYKALQINANHYICIYKYTLLYKNERFRIDSSMLHL